MSISNYSQAILPKTWQNKLDAQFQKPVISLSKDKNFELPAFDMVRLQ